MREYAHARAARAAQYAGRIGAGAGPDPGVVRASVHCSDAMVAQGMARCAAERAHGGEAWLWPA